MLNTFPHKTPQIRPNSSKCPHINANGLRTSFASFTHQEQMARVTSELQHQKRIKNNLLNKQKQQDQSIKQNSLRLKSKMQGTEQKRQQKFGQKQKAYKMNEEKWTRKIEQIQTKFKHQNRQAMEKAEKYRQESEDYWKNKESQLATARGTSYQKFDLNKTEKFLGRNTGESYLLNKNLKESSSIRRNKYLQMKVDTLDLEQPTFLLNSQISRGQLKHSRTIDIDGEISKHKQKSSMLQKERQMQVFQNAMKRLAKIQLTRTRADKLKEPSKSPVQIRKPKKNVPDDDNLYNSESIHKRNNSFQPSKSKQSLLNQSIQSHIKAKRLLEEQQFKQRDKILENQHTRKRQNRILKAIKNKIKDIKSSTIKMQTLQ